MNEKHFKTDKQLTDGEVSSVENQALSKFKRLRKSLLGYGLALALFAVIIAISALLLYFEIKINLTILVIAGLVLATWYGNTGPGILLAVLIQLTSILWTPIPPDSSMPKVVFGHFTVFALLIFIVLIIGGRKASEMRLREQSSLLRTLNETLEQRVEERTAELRTSEERFHTLFESIDEGFCIIEMIFDEQEKPVDYRFLQVNPSFERHTGLRDVVGKRMLELSPSQEKHWFETFGRIAVTGEADRFQNHSEYLHRWYDVYACRFGDTQNRQVAVVFSDITERKEAEANIERLNADLQLRAVQLEETNKELESFSYSVSHDLRAPLRHIDGFVQLLAKREAARFEAASLHYLNVISDAVGRMGLLIDELLAFSRTGRQQLRSSRVDLNNLIKQSFDDLAPATAGRDIKWKISPLPTVLGDPTLLGLVMTNLISNAIKYTRLCDVARIEIGVEDSADGHATIFVRDNGAGFDMRYADKLFGVFQRLHRESEFEGIGIGLATVHRIVTRHGGRVWAESEPDKGAIFFVRLSKAKGETI